MPPSPYAAPSAATAVRRTVVRHTVVRHHRPPHRLPHRSPPHRSPPHRSPPHRLLPLHPPHHLPLPPSAAPSSATAAAAVRQRRRPCGHPHSPVYLIPHLTDHPFTRSPISRKKPLHSPDSSGRTAAFVKCNGLRAEPAAHHSRIDCAPGAARGQWFPIICTQY